MKKWKKKSISFLLAVSMLSSSCIIAFASETANNGITVIAEAVYDEAVTVNDGVIFLQNGNWSDSEGYEDFYYEYDKLTQYENVSADTSIIFMDEDGSKTVISNIDSSGEVLFDAVYPIISTAYDYQLLRLIKDNKTSYLTKDGKFFGGELQYYNYSQPVEEDLLLVSDDGVQYRLINSNNDTIADKMTFSSYESVGYSYESVGNNVYITCEDKIVVADESGESVNEYFKGEADYIYSLSMGEGYGMIYTDTEHIILGPDGKELYKLGDVSVEYISDMVENGYLYISDYNNNKYSIIDINTGMTIFSCLEWMNIYEGETIIISENDITSVRDIDGKIYIEDLNKYLNELAQGVGVNSYTFNYEYRNGKLLVSIINESNSDDAYTFILDKENNFIYDNNKLEGVFAEASYNGEYICTQDSEGYLKNIYSVDGKLIKNYSNKEKWHCRRIFNSHQSIDYNAMSEFIFLISDNVGYAYITSDGDVSKTYTRITAENKYIFAYDDENGTVDVINSSNEIVYSGSGKYNYELSSAGSLNYHDYFYVLNDERYYLYDGNGNLILGNDAEFAAIGSSEIISGFYPAREGEFYPSAFYNYTNKDLSNGLCVVKIKDGDSYKYGAISLGIITEKGDINDDNKINATDALIVLKYAAKITPLDDISIADVNGDGVVNASDALLILKYAAKLIEGFY